MQINEIVKEIRIKANKTQEEFANSIQVSRGTISQIEGGRANPTIDILEKIISNYSLDANIFFKKDIPNFVPNNIPIGKNISNLSNWINENDLNILNSIIYFPSLKDLDKYSYLTDNELKIVKSEIYNNINIKINTINSINQVARILKIKQTKYKFIDLVTKDFISNALKDYNPKDWDDDFKFESNKTYNLVNIYALNEALEHLGFIIDHQIDYLLKQCALNIQDGLITINESGIK